MSNEKIEILAKRWKTGKEMIDNLKRELEEIESEMMPELESVEGGSKSNKLENYKINIKRPLYYSIDGESWETIRDRIPAELWPIKLKTEADEKGCKWLAENKPELWAIAAQSISIKPGKPNFTIEYLNKDTKEV